MKNKIEFIDYLNKILAEKEPARIDLIKYLQEEIWNSEIINNEIINEILIEFAYDLDFYEPNEEWRKENSSYFGGKRLEELIKQAIGKIKNCNWL